MNNLEINQRRLHYLDNLRFLIVILVIIHHVGQGYIPTGGVWPIKDGPQILIFSKFFSINAGYFMGLLFLISGYVMDDAYRKYGGINFIMGKLKRLLFPSLFIMFILACFAYLTGKFNSIVTFFSLISEAEGLQQIIGHLWYIVHLLFYSFCYFIYRQISSRFINESDSVVMKDANISSVKFHSCVIFLTAVVIVISYFTRLIYPLDKWITFLKIIPFEAAHLPQYSTMFITGLICGKLKLFQRIKSIDGYAWLAVGILAVIFRYTPLIYKLIELAAVQNPDQNSCLLVFVIWETILCTGLSIGLVTIFRDKFDFTNRILNFHSNNSYGLYLIHVFPIVGMQALVIGVQISTWVKFILISILSTYMGYAIVALIRKSKLVRKYI